MSNYLFHTFADGVPERRRQMVCYRGKDTGTNRIDLQHLMGRLGFDSSIIEVTGSVTKDEAYDLAKLYAKRFGLPVVTDKENLAKMKAVNTKSDKHEKLIVSAVKKLNIPDDLKEDLLNSVKADVEHWRGWQQEQL